MNSRLAALDTLTACLSITPLGMHSKAFRRKITAQSMDWPAVIGLANLHLVSPTLWTALQRERLEGYLPDEVQDYLREVHRLNTRRNQGLRQQSAQLISTLNAIGVKPVLLKGTASLFANIYGDPGSRMQTDIDLLVPRDRAEECWGLLREQGYSPLEEDYDNSQHHHLNPLTRGGEYAVVEIHRDALQHGSTGRLFGIPLTPGATGRFTRLIADSSLPQVRDGLEFGLPNPTCRLLHCLLHSAFWEANAHRSGTLPLKSLHEMALIQQRFASEIAWQQIAQVLADNRTFGLVQTWMYLAHRLFGCSLPQGWAITPGMRAHYLRCRIQARWNLSITLLHIRRLW